MTTSLRLSVLHFGQVSRDRSAYHALQEVVELAPLLEQLGYERLWIGEHHAPHFAWSTPEVLLGVLAGVTRRLRVGSGCVLLKYHSPYRVASAFRLLGALYPGRIDLGVGAGVVSSEHEHALLGGMGSGEAGEYAERVRELKAHVEGRGTGGAVATVPVGVEPPRLWVMGSSRESARLAGRCGASYCYALFSPSSERDPAVLAAYRDAFIGTEPEAAVAVAGICDNAEAAGRRDGDGSSPLGFARPSFAGGPEASADALADIAHRFATDRIVFLNLAREGAQRRALSLLANAVGLPREGAGDGVDADTAAQSLAPASGA